MRKEKIWDATKIESWAKAACVPETLKTQLKQLSEKDLAIAFSRTSLSFGTAGIRGKMGPGPHLLNKFVYRQLMIGYCKFLLSKYKEPAIIIAHDNRLFSDEFAQECAQVASNMGLIVFLPERNKLLPTPILSYAIRKYRLDGGINVTASHNPKTDNGFKAYNHLGAQVLPNEAKIITKNMPNSKHILNLNKFIVGKKKGEIRYIPYKELTNNFFEEVMNKTCIDRSFLLPNAPLKKFPIIFTGFHGTTTELMPHFLKRIGFKKVYVCPQHAWVSPKFEECVTSNPEDPKAFKDLIPFALKKKATIIIACDPDGDRMAMAFKKTTRWRILNGNEMGIIFSHYILNRRQFNKKTPVIFSSHVSTNYIDRVAKKYKAEVIRTKTGFKWLGNMVDSLPRNKQFILGFEEAIGALTHNACRDKDAFGSVFLALEIINQGNAFFPDLHDYLCDRIYDLYGPTFSKTYSYIIDSTNWKADAKKMMARAKNVKERKIFDYTIQKVFFEKESDCVVWKLDKDSWIKFRISGTEPKFKVYFCFNNQMGGQLKAAAVINIKRIEESILKGFNYTK